MAAIAPHSTTPAEQLLMQLKAKPALAIGLLPATGAIASAIHSAITGNAMTANIAVSLFKVAFMAPSLQGFISEWHKDPSERNMTELFKRVMENICLGISAIAPWGPMAEYIALAIVTTVPVPSMVASSIPGFPELYKTFIAFTSGATAVLGGMSLAEGDIGQELKYANLAGAVLSLSFLFLDLPDTPERIFATGAVLSMLGAASVQIAALFVEQPALFPVALLCLALGAACVNSKLLTLGMPASAPAPGYRALAAVEAGEAGAKDAKDAKVWYCCARRKGDKEPTGPAADPTSLH